MSWLELQLETLFVHDDRGRLVRDNEPGWKLADRGAVPPRFFFGRTRHGNSWRFRADTAPELVRALSRLAARERPLQSVDGGVPERWGAIREHLEGAAALQEWSGPAYRFSSSRRPLSLERGARLGEPDGSEEGFDEFAGPAGPGLLRSIRAGSPVAAIELEGRIASACWTARGGGEGGAEAGVYTLGFARGRGLAVSALARWADMVRERGAVPLYSTSFANRAARAVARRLALECYGENWHLR